MDEDLGGIDFSGFDNTDISSLLNGDGGSSGIDFSQIGGDYGGSLSDELAAALSDYGNSSSLFSGDGGLDIASLMNESQGDLDQAAPPVGIADLLASMTKEPGGDLVNTDFQSLYNEGLTPEEQAKREALLADYSKYNQDFGGADVTKYLDEFNQNFNPIGGMGSQWQTSGSDRIMVNDDGTAIGINTETGETYSLNKDQVDKMVANNQINNKASGYVDSTGGKGYVPGGGKTILNADGTKSVIGTDGKVYTITTDGKVIDTGKTVNVNDKTIETKTIKEIIDNSKNTTTPGKNTTTTTQAKSASNNNGMLMALLALMAMMNKGAGSSSGSNAVIPSLQADRKQLPYGPVAGAPAARPGAGGVTYFSPTTYTPKAAGGGLMSLAGGGTTSETVEQWAARQPDISKIADPMAREQTLETWQKQRPGYVDPINYNSYDAYAGAAGIRDEGGGSGQDLQNRANFYGLTPENYNNVLSGDMTRPMGENQSVYGAQLLSPVQRLAAETARGQGISNMTPQVAALAKANPEIFNTAAQRFNSYMAKTYPNSLPYSKKMASGGLSDLGGYSDGGRLLRGPGDGVSDSIPATIGGKQPARLATGEFVVPARIVSELGNGSTDAGAQKLYAMMDRVQQARRKTKNVAADTKAHKYLPA
jgi:hypothetical protein